MRPSVMLMILTAAVAVAGCAKRGDVASQPGANRSAVQPSPDYHADALGLDLASASESDPAVPGDSGFQGGMAALNPAYVGREAILQNTLNLSAAGVAKAFFVWPEGEGKNRIIQASFAVRNQSVDNHLNGSPTYQLASHDQDGKRYFIPLERALSARAEDLGPADDQILLLRLGFDGGAVVDLSVRFRVAGPLTALQIIHDDATGPALSGPLFVQKGLSISLRRVTFQNVMARPVTLWLRASPTGDPLMLSAEESPYPIQANAPLHMDKVLDRRSGVSFPYDPSTGRAMGWAPVTFGPREQVTLEWIATTHGCAGYSSDLGVLKASGTWAMDAWLTDSSLRTLPSDYARLPPSLSLNLGRMVRTVQGNTHPGLWGVNIQVACP